jgi:methylmalonyl-CoA mutase
MHNFLFDNFPTATSKQWKQKIQVDLKGADYNSTLVTNTNEGICIKPFYHSDNFKQLEFEPSHDKQVILCQSFFVHDAKTANFLAKNALKKGVDSVKFIADKSFDPAVLLSGLKDAVIYFELSFLDKDFILNMMNHVKEQKIFLNIDLIGNLAKTGNWFFNNKQDHQVLKSILNRSSSNVSVLGIDVTNYQNAGANTVQQVAYALAHGNEYLNFLFNIKNNNELSRIEIDGIGQNINFTFSQGGNYFFEIAKLRAFRYLWDLLLGEYHMVSETNILAEPSLRNKTLYDYNTNLLRSTTESMSSILGGANTVCNLAYDAVFHKKNEFGERISRNQLIILKEESHIKNTDATLGSYYIEELTFEIAEKALEIFKDIEKTGGFVKQLFEGTIQRKINENAHKEQVQFDAGDLILLGTNKHPNMKDKMKDELKIYPFVRKKNIKTEIQPIIAKRLAEKVEKERMEKE